MKKHEKKVINNAKQYKMLEELKLKLTMHLSPTKRKSLQILLMTINKYFIIRSYFKILHKTE